jgi:hypothetical protein
MNAGQAREMTLRPGQRELKRLAWAVGISLAIHLLGYGGYEGGRKLGLWQAFHMPAWLAKTKLLAALAEQQKKPAEEIPLIYVDVSPRQATDEAPKNAKYYSNRNSQAANPEADKESDLPKISGTQTQVPKTEDTPRSPYDKLRPTPRPQEEVRSKPVGDLAMTKPPPTLRAEEGPQPRPRTIREAMMRQQRDQLIGEKMKSEGGVKNRVELTALDAKASVFGDYDAEFINIVQSRWYDLLDNLSFDGYRRGRVALEFRLHYDGQITDMKVLDESVGTMLSLMCQKAISDPSPYRKWEREMRLMVDKDYRELKFTFFYN